MKTINYEGMSQYLTDQCTMNCCPLTEKYGEEMDEDEKCPVKCPFGGEFFRDDPCGDVDEIKWEKSLRKNKKLRDWVRYEIFGEF